MAVDIAPQAPAPERPSRRRPERHVPEIVVWNLRNGQRTPDLGRSSQSAGGDAQGRPTIATSIDARYRAILEGRTIVIQDRHEDLIAEVCRLVPDYEFTNEESRHYLRNAEPAHQRTH
jgi:hypothetical protein